MTKPQRSLRELDEVRPFGDDQLLNEEQAADMLAVNPDTMKRGRESGNGPPFVRFPSMSGSTGRNAIIRYRLGDLRRWIQQHTRTDQHTSGEGMMGFVPTWDHTPDLQRGDPWLLDAQGWLLGHGLLVEQDTLDEAQGVVWASLDEVLFDERVWADTSEMGAWMECYKTAVARTLADAEKANLMAHLGPVDGSDRRPIRHI